MTKFSEYKNKSWIYSAVLILCVLQPVLDVISYWLDEWKSDNTVSLALRFIIFLAVVIISWTISNNKRPYIILTSLSLVLIILHMLFCKLHWQDIYNLSWAFSDIANYIRVLQIPYFTIALITCFKELEDKNKLYTTIEFGLFINLLFIVLIEILSTITGSDPHTYPNKSLGVLGWFYFANSQSAILCAIIPIAIGFSYKKFSNMGIVITSLLSFAVLYLFGTRLSYLGIFVITLGILITLLINDHHEKKATLLVCMLVGAIVCGAFFHYAPFYKNQSKHQEILSEEQADIDKLIDLGKFQFGDEGKDYLRPAYQKYLGGLVDRFGFDEIASEYNYSESAEEIINWRRMKLVFNELLMRASPVPIHLFGLPLDSLTFDDYIYDVENDWHGMYYLFGLSGLLFIAAFILYFVFMIVKALIADFKQTFNISSGVVGIALIMLLLHVYFTAGVLRRPNASFYVSICLAMSYYLVTLRKEGDLFDCR